MEATPPAGAAEQSNDTLHRVRQRRAELRVAEEQLASAAASPSPGRLDLWWARVNHAAAELAARFHEHVHDTESEGGLFAEIEAEAPRLSRDVDRLRAEHASIATSLRTLTDRRQPVTDTDVSTAREQILDLLSELARHRFAGSDLLYQAYQVDIGEGG
jgi:hypothetical protein